MIMRIGMELMARGKPPLGLWFRRCGPNQFNTYKGKTAIWKPAKNPLIPFGNIPVTP